MTEIKEKYEGISMQNLKLNAFWMQPPHATMNHLIHLDLLFVHPMGVIFIFPKQMPDKIFKIIRILIRFVQSSDALHNAWGTELDIIFSSIIEFRKRQIQTTNFGSSCFGRTQYCSKYWLYWTICMRWCACESYAN